MGRIDDGDPGMEQIQGVMPDLSEEPIEMERVDQVFPADIQPQAPEPEGR